MTVQIYLDLRVQRIQRRKDILKKKKDFYYEKNSNFASTLFQSNKNKIGSSEKGQTKWQTTAIRLGAKHNIGWVPLC